MRYRKRLSKRRERSCDRLLAFRIGVRMKQADREYLRAAVGSHPANSRELRAAQRLDDAAIEQRALGDTEAHRAADERLWPRRGQRVQVVAILPADLDQ